METWGHFQPGLWRPKLDVFFMRSQSITSCLWQQNQVFFRDLWTFPSIFVENQMRYFHPKQDIFFLNLTLAQAQQCDKRIEPKQT